MGDNVEGGRLLRQRFEQHPGILLGCPGHAEMIERENAIRVAVLDAIEEICPSEIAIRGGGIRKRPMNEEERPLGRYRLCRRERASGERVLCDFDPPFCESALLPHRLLERFGKPRQDEARGLVRRHLYHLDHHRLDCLIEQAA